MKEKVFAFIVSQGYSEAYARALTAQAWHETGNWTSNVWNQANNMFGMKVAQKRPQNNSGSYNSYATYSSWEDGVLDRIALDTYFKTEKPEDNSQVLFYMKEVQLKGYAEDGSYVTKWHNIYNQLYPAFELGGSTALGVDDSSTSSPMKISAIGWIAVALIVFVLFFKKKTYSRVYSRVRRATRRRTPRRRTARRILRRRTRRR